MKPGITLLIGALALVASAPAVAGPRLPEPPRAEVDTRMPASPGTVHRVAANGDLRKALAAAVPGDVVQLDAGATYTGPLELPAKSGDGWIVITGSAQDRLPPPGTRVRPADAVHMPKIVTKSGEPAIVTAPGAHHYRFVGVEIAPAKGVFVQNLVRLGRDETSADRLPHHIVFDRCVVRGDPDRGGRRGIAINSASTAVIDSHLADFKEVDADSQAIGGWNGPGPFAIVNNYLEAAGENVMFGGADATIPNLTPSDILVRGNHLAKPVAWRGRSWSVKNLFELKHARRVVVEGNLFENNWPAAQNGFSILFTVRNQDGGNPWATVEDVRFAHNVVRNVAAGVNILGQDDNHTSRQAKRILIENNLFYQVGTKPWGGNGALVMLLGATEDVVVQKNTAVQAGAIVFAEGAGHRGFVFRDNVVMANDAGISGTGTGPGRTTLERYFPAAVVTGNVIVGASAGDYPPGNHFPGSLNTVGFVDASRGRLRLTARSPFRGKSGTPGADFDTLATTVLGGAPPAELRQLLAGAE
jgi:hypothetical protein